MNQKKGSVAERVERVVAPIAQELGLSIWDIEFRKEGSDYFLCIYIDKEGGVSINDCEAFSRAVDAPLDEADPIEPSYYLEVSSAGIERSLKKDAHFIASLGREVRITLYQGRDGEKTLEGFLEGYENGTITLKRYDGSFLELEKSEWGGASILEKF